MGGTKTTGGRGWKHACSIRLGLKRYKFFDEKRTPLTSNAENPFGHTIRVTLDKTRICPPDRRLTTYTLIYTYGIDVIADTIKAGLEVGAVSQKGAWFELVDLETGEILEGTKVQGEPNMRKYLVKNRGVFDKLYNQIYNHISDSSMYFQEDFITGEED